MKNGENKSNEKWRNIKDEFKKKGLKGLITAIISAGLIPTVCFFSAAAAAASVLTVAFVNVVDYVSDVIEEKKQEAEERRLAEISAAVEDALNKVPNIAPKKDKNAEKVEDVVSKGTTAGGGGSVTLEYTDQVIISKATGLVNMHFKNPATSNQDMVIQIVIQGDGTSYVLMQSDKVSPGYILRTSNADSKLLSLTKKGVYDGVYHIYYYDINTGNKALVDTEIPIEITITD